MSILLFFHYYLCFLAFLFGTYRFDCLQVNVLESLVPLMRIGLLRLHRNRITVQIAPLQTGIFLLHYVVSQLLFCVDRNSKTMLYICFLGLSRRGEAKPAIPLSMSINQDINFAQELIQGILCYWYLEYCSCLGISQPLYCHFNRSQSASTST